jgi:hypothetical protein
MKEYWSIGGPASGQHKPCYTFVKYDGSNIRCEWSRKRGWYKFGTRKTMIDHTHHIYGSAVTLFLHKYGDDLEKVFKSEKDFRGVQSFIVFSEWFGKQSFAGMHMPDDERDIVLFDVNPHKKGILGPKEFVDLFGHLDVAEVICQGNFGPALVESVRKETIEIESKYSIKPEVPEGVVCKGEKGHKLWMAKIKTERYKEALKERFDQDWERFWE